MLFNFFFTNIFICFKNINITASYVCYWFILIVYFFKKYI